MSKYFRHFFWQWLVEADVNWTKNTDSRNEDEMLWFPIILRNLWDYEFWKDKAAPR